MEVVGFVGVFGVRMVWFVGVNVISGENMLLFLFCLGECFSVL